MNKCEERQDPWMISDYKMNIGILYMSSEAFGIDVDLYSKQKEDLITELESYAQPYVIFDVKHPYDTGSTYRGNPVRKTILDMLKGDRIEYLLKVMRSLGPDDTHFIARVQANSITLKLDGPEDTRFTLDWFLGIDCSLHASSAYRCSRSYTLPSRNPFNQESNENAEK